MEPPTWLTIPYFLMLFLGFSFLVWMLLLQNKTFSDISRISLSYGDSPVWGGLFIGLVSCVLAFVFHLLTKRALSRFLLRFQEINPSRWYSPAPLPNDKSPIVTKQRKKLSGHGKTLISPFTKTPCIAYRACILFTDPNDAYPPIWFLDECQSVQIAQKTTTSKPKRGLLQKKLKPVAANELALDELELHAFLRKRGLYPDDGFLELYEVTIQEGEEATTIEYKEPQNAAIIIK